MNKFQIRNFLRGSFIIQGFLIGLCPTVWGMNGSLPSSYYEEDPFASDDERKCSQKPSPALQKGPLLKLREGLYESSIRFIQFIEDRL